jgi:thiol:disulfide interchange protein DsbD
MKTVARTTLSIALPILWSVLSCAVSVAQETPPAEPKPSFPSSRPRDPLSPPDATPQPPNRGNSTEQLVKVRTLADVDRITPGSKFNLAFEFTLEPNWHIYWKNQGASGGPTEIKVTGPSGFGIGKTLYPRPIAIRSEEGVSYGYQDKVIIFVEVSAPPETFSNMAMFNAQINWMVCKDVCLLGRTRQSISVPVGSGDPPSPLSPGVDPAVKEWQKRLPQKLSTASGSQINFDGATLTIRIPAQGRAKGEFFPLEVPGVTYGDATFKVESDILSVSVPVTIKPGDSLGKPMKIAGVVGLGASQTDPSYEFEIPPTAS